MAQANIDKLLSLTDSRYRLSRIIGLRAAQLKNGFPPLLSHEEYPKTRNAVSLAMREFELGKPLVWGKELPDLATLKQDLEQEKRFEESRKHYAVRSKPAGLGQG